MLNIEHDHLCVHILVDVITMNIEHYHLCVHRPLRLHFNSWSRVRYSQMSILLSVWALNLLSFTCDLVLNIVAKLILCHDYGQIVGPNNAYNRTIAPIKQAPLQCQLQHDIVNVWAPLLSSIPVPPQVCSVSFPVRKNSFVFQTLYYLLFFIIILGSLCRSKIV